VKVSDDRQVLTNVNVAGCAIVKHLLDHLVAAIHVYEAK
jgi:hypothetical protein